MASACLQQPSTSASAATWRSKETATCVLPPRSCRGARGPPPDTPVRCAAVRRAAPQSAARTQQVQSVAPVPQPTPAPLLSQHAVDLAVLALTAYHVAIFAAMLWVRNALPMRRFMCSVWPFLPLLLGYGLLLVNSWSPDTLSIMMPGSLEAGLQGGFNPQFIPKLESIAVLFQRPMTAASWLIHVWAINLFLGRTIYVEGMAQGFPTWHSLILACFFGPLGVISHKLTRRLCKPSPVIVRGTSSGGVVILLPYSDK